MNEEMLKTLSDEEKRRKQHPYWIYESIQMIPEMLSGCLERGVKKQIDHVLDQLLERNIQKIIFTGRGSSFFLTLSLNYIFNDLTKTPTHSCLTNLLEIYHLQDLDARTAVFVHSTSGKSEGDKKVVGQAQAQGVYTIGVTDIPTSTLANTADDVIVGPGGAKVELPATRTYATALFRMSLLAIELAKRQGNDEGAEQYEKFLVKIPDLLKKSMPVWEKRATEIISKIETCTAFFVLGYGPNLSTADETALAFGQCGGIPTMPFELENFIHGPIQFLTKEMGVIAIANEGPLQDRMLRAAMAAKTIGANTFIITPESLGQLPYADAQLNIPDGIPEALSPIMTMVPMWQTAYELGRLERGGHPDRLSMDKEEFMAGMKYLMSQDKWVA